MFLAGLRFHSNGTVSQVSDYGCKGGVNGTGAGDDAHPSGFPVNCSAAVAAAIKAAGANGGGTVFFGPGRWYVDGPLLLPQGVLLKGARMDLTAIYFAESTSETRPGNHSAPASLIATDGRPCTEHCTEQPDAPRFGVEDLAIYVLGYYKNVIDIRVDTVGVRIRRVRIRANAFHCQARGSEGGPGGGRSVPWTFQGGGFKYAPIVSFDFCARKSERHWCLPQPADLDPVSATARFPSYTGSLRSFRLGRTLNDSLFQAFCSCN